MENKTFTIYTCPNCRVTIRDGRIFWSCDDFHGEYLAWLEQQEEDESNDEDSSDNLDVFEETR